MAHRSATHRSTPPPVGGAFAGAIAGTIAATIVALVLITGLGLAPPRILGDPLGLDGLPIRTRIGGDGSVAAAVGTVRSGFGDVSTLLAPERLELEQLLAGRATVTAPAGADLPDTIALTDLSLDVTVSDARSSTTFTLLASGGAVLIRNGEGYGMTPVAFSALLSGARMERLHPILTGGSDNTVVAALNLTATSTPPLPAGSHIEFAFGSGSGMIGF